jgi:hypothetical protein
MTTSDDEIAIERPCAANVEYKDRQGGCQREGRYPDADGVRWWCGLHNPDRVKPKARHAPLEETEPQEGIREVLLNQKSPQVRELLDIVQEAQHVLFEISNTRDIGWPENTPTEKYRILMAHMADRAKEVYESLTERISRFRT